MALSLVVLAAGIGSRYGGLKQMEPVGPSGEFLIDYAIYDAIRAGFGRIVLVLRKDIEDEFKRTVGARIRGPIDVVYVFQELSDLPDGFSLPQGRTKPWGTGQASLTAASAVDGPFVVINADDFYGAHAYRVLADYLRETASEESRYAMVGYRLENTLSDHGHVSRGICSADQHGILTDVEELTRIERGPNGIRHADRTLTGKELVSMNFWGFKLGFMDYLRTEFKNFLSKSGDDLKEEFFVPAVVNTLVASGLVSVAVLETTGAWAGVTYPDERIGVAATLRTMVDEGIYPESLWG